jgi:hypothetical protein
VAIDCDDEIPPRTSAVLERDVRRILDALADIGHYIADANVPQHNGKIITDKIDEPSRDHGLSPACLPELYSDDYDLLIGRFTT